MRVPRPSACNNAACSMKSIVVTTDRVDCLGCRSMLRKWLSAEEKNIRDLFDLPGLERGGLGVTGRFCSKPLDKCSASCYIGVMEMNTDLTTTHCPSCGLTRTIHIDSLPAIERNGFLCSDCFSDTDRHEHGWTPANSLS